MLRPCSPAWLFGSSVKYPAMGADHPLPPECHDDQQRLEDAELSRPPWKDWIDCERRTACGREFQSVMARGKKNKYFKASVRTDNDINLFSLEALVCRDKTERWSREMIVIDVIVPYWLPVTQRIQFSATAFDCVRGTGPVYFRDVCTTVVDTSSRTNLRSAHRGDMFVPWNHDTARPTKLPCCCSNCLEFSVTLASLRGRPGHCPK